MKNLGYLSNETCGRNLAKVIAKVLVNFQNALEKNVLQLNQSTEFYQKVERLQKKSLHPVSRWRVLADFILHAWRIVAV